MSAGGAGPAPRRPRPAPALGTTGLPVPLGDEAPVFSVGQVSDLLGVQQAFLRRLDDVGVVSPQRTDGGQRRYSQNEVRAVTTVLGLVDEGITLAGVQRILALQEQVDALTRELARERARRRKDVQTP